MGQRFRLLTEADVRRLLPPPELVATMENALQRFSAREVLQPVRTVLSVPPTHAFFGLMPAYVPAPARLGAKLVTVFQGNEQRGLPSHLATIFLLDPETGALKGLLDGRYITEMRTAAVSAVSARWLAAPQSAYTLALIGSGVQARSHLEVLGATLPLDRVQVWSPREASRTRFVQEMQPKVSCRIHAVATASDAVNDADLLVLVTSSATPVVQAEWVRTGAHVISVGACRPEQCEMDGALVSRARVFVDSRDAALVESGDIVQRIRDRLFGPGHIAGELGEVIGGQVRGRSSDDQVTLFKSLGMAVEDVTAASLVLRRAVELGVGAEHEL